MQSGMHTVGYQVEKIEERVARTTRRPLKPARAKLQRLTLAP